MRIFIAMIALVTLGGCVAHNFAEGRRVNWRCDGGKEFSLRYVGDAAEVYASGQTHQLPRVESEGRTRRYSDGAITYVENGRGSLTGVYNGPFENCRRRGGFSLW